MPKCPPDCQENCMDDRGEFQAAIISLVRTWRYIIHQHPDHTPTLPAAYLCFGTRLHFFINLDLAEPKQKVERTTPPQGCPSSAVPTKSTPSPLDARRSIHLSASPSSSYLIRAPARNWPAPSCLQAQLQGCWPVSSNRCRPTKISQASPAGWPIITYSSGR
jgi:hypothetical protein